MLCFCVCHRDVDCASDWFVHTCLPHVVTVIALGSSLMPRTALEDYPYALAAPSPYHNFIVARSSVHTMASAHDDSPLRIGKDAMPIGLVDAICDKAVVADLATLALPVAQVAARPAKRPATSKPKAKQTGKIVDKGKHPKPPGTKVKAACKQKAKKTGKTADAGSGSTAPGNNVEQEPISGGAVATKRSVVETSQVDTSSTSPYSIGDNGLELRDYVKYRKFHQLLDKGALPRPA